MFLAVLMNSFSRIIGTEAWTRQSFVPGFSWLLVFCRYLPKNLAFWRTRICSNYASVPNPLLPDLQIDCLLLFCGRIYQKNLILYRKHCSWCRHRAARESLLIYALLQISSALFFIQRPCQNTEHPAVRAAVVCAGCRSLVSVQKHQYQKLSSMNIHEISWILNSNLQIPGNSVWWGTRIYSN